MHNARHHPAAGTYPRADLGLPINVQQLGGEPFPVIQGAQNGASRMASPLILKALSVSATQAIPVMLMLNAPHVYDPATPKVELKRGDVKVDI
jgi:CRISPR/Cas system CMR-associated protein Cmr1 (group 7 of RAMP superfamily)